MNSPPVTGSVSQLIADMKEGNAQALQELHHRYWPQVVGIAKNRIRNTGLQHADEEDVAQSALIGFYDVIRKKSATQLENRGQLLALLSHIVACKAANQIQRAMAQKRGGGKNVSLTPLAFLAADSDPTSSQAVILKECYDRHVIGLPEELRAFAELHLAGFTHAEIAEQLKCVERTVERKLALLRTRWRLLAEEVIED